MDGLVDSLALTPVFSCLHWIGLLRAHVLNLLENDSESPNMILTHFFCALKRGKSLFNDTPPHTVTP